MIDEAIQQRLLQPLMGLLKQGVTPERIALSLTLGVTIGVFPALGWTTILCTIIALVLRLNLPAIQLVNYLVYPLQLALLLPFYRLGEKVFHAAHLPISPQQILAMAKTNLQATVAFLWSTTWHAIVIWAMFAPVATAIIYLLLLSLVRRVIQSQTVAGTI
jgi:uncharacterized protein (DUF2062 family)